MTGILRSILDAINSFVQNYGWSTVLFTVLIRVVLMPLDYRSRKSMRKMSQVQTQINALQKKYANDKQKLNQKMSELYKKEGVSPLSGCVPMLIQWPILFAMFAAMRAIANEQMVAQVFRYLADASSPVAKGESWLWVKNVWAADSLFTPIAPSTRNLQMIGADVWSKVYSNLGQFLTEDQAAKIMAMGSLDFSNDAFKTTVSALLTQLNEKQAYLNDIAKLPGFSNINLMLFNFSVYQKWNGLLILPALAGASQIIMTKLTPQPNAQPAGQQNDTAASTGKFMQVFFPLLSIYFCLTSSASFAIYWVTSNIAMGISSFLINKHLEKHAPQQSNRMQGEGMVK